MSDSPKPFSLRRWSQRKLDAGRSTGDANVEQDARTSLPGETPVAASAAVASAAGLPESAGASAGMTLARGTTVAGPEAADHPFGVSPSDSGSGSARIARERPLPSVESLTFESDFAPFMREGVDDATRRSALAKLLHDPSFNVMDGLDVYIDDYSKPDPIDPAIVRTLVQARYIFDPPQTRVNAQGHVEDVPPADVEAVVPDAADVEPAAADSPSDRPPEIGPDAGPATEPSGPVGTVTIAVSR